MKKSFSSEMRIFEHQRWQVIFIWILEVSLVFREVK